MFWNICAPPSCSLHLSTSYDYKVTRQWAHCRFFVLHISIAGYAIIATLFINNFVIAFCPGSCYNITRHRTVLRSFSLGGRWFLRSLPPPSCLFLLSAAPALAVVGVSSPVSQFHPSFRLVLVAVVRFLGEPFGEFCEFFLGCVLQCFFVHVVFLSQLDNNIIAYPRGDCNFILDFFFLVKRQFLR